MPSHSVDRGPGTPSPSVFPAARGLETGPAPQDTRPQASATPAAAPSLPIQPEGPKGAARNIKLEVNSGEQRVELRLVDQGGDVHVAVRTPDSRLAGELRDNLPTLSSRLEQTGLHPEEWHTPAPVSGESRRPAEHVVDASGTDPNPQSQSDRHQQQGDPQQRAHKVPEEQNNRKQKGKQFAWYMAPQP